MKRVFSDTRQCVHVWAQNSQDEGRCGNVFFEGAVIYSYGYHFPMARHVTNGAGEEAVLLTTAKFSISTGRHQSFVLGAVSHRKRFCVTHLGRSRFGACNLTPEDHKLNLRDYRVRIEESVLRARRARGNKDWGLARALGNEANAYAEFFGLPERVQPLSDELVREIEEAARRAEAAERERRRLKDRANAAAVEEWKAGERMVCPRTDKVHLRLWGDEVETSWGARVPLGAARALLPFLRKGEMPPPAFRRVGDFHVDEVTATRFKVGCHTVETAEVERLAAQLGL
jgi:hypothetical protein